MNLFADLSCTHVGLGIVEMPFQELLGKTCCQYLALLTIGNQLRFHSTCGVKYFKLILRRRPPMH